MNPSSTSSIAGYAYGMSAVSPSPITPAEFELMKQNVLFSEEDVQALRMSLEVLRDAVEDILDVWYGFVGSQPHLLKSFSSRTDGAPLEGYLARVRERFRLWILDTARADYDETWLAYQHEIGLRHHRTKKNLTDGAPSTSIVPFRDLFGLVYPITFTLRPFLARGGHSAEQVEKMASAWVKSCLLQVSLWSYAYVKDGDY